MPTLPWNVYDRNTIDTDESPGVLFPHKIRADWEFLTVVKWNEVTYYRDIKNLHYINKRIRNVNMCEFVQVWIKKHIGRHKHPLLKCEINSDLFFAESKICFCTKKNRAVNFTLNITQKVSIKSSKWNKIKMENNRSSRWTVRRY